MSLNEVRLLGNVGRDPEIRSTNSGNMVAQFSIATSEKWRDKNTGDDREATEWHNIVVWGDGLVDKVIRPHVKKGSKLFVAGKMKTRKWTDSNGTDRWTTEVVVQGFAGKLELCSGQKGGAPAPAGPDDYGASTPTEQRPSDPDDIDDDIPF